MSGVLRTREARRAVETEILEELRYVRAHLTEAAERTGTGVVNHVLQVGTGIFDADGRVTLDFGVPIGSIEVNAIDGDVTVAAGGPISGTTAPASGTGVYIVEENTMRRVNIGARQVTLYGTATERVSYQAFTTGSARSGT